MVIAYEKNGSVYYDFDNRKLNLVSSNSSLVSVSGNTIVYRKNNTGTVYKVTVDQNGFIHEHCVVN